MSCRTMSFGAVSFRDITFRTLTFRAAVGRTAAPAMAAAAVVVAATVLGSVAVGQGDEFEREPIQYSKATPDNSITRLQARLDGGSARLNYEPGFGYLRSVLEELRVSARSQSLVFSKTSLQRQRISPRTPRALYFNDEVYVGFCQHGDVMEVSAVDPRLGTVFYTLEQRAADRPKFLRQGDNCLICHGSSHTLGIPGHLVRSVFPDPDGQPLLASGTYRVDQTTPLENRWGGWYVSGRHGPQKHMGNLIVRGRQPPMPLDNTAGQNVVDLSDRFRTAAYLTPHSDIVALLVLEHQAMAHNLITHAHFTTRQALHQEAALNRELGKPAAHRWPSTTSRIQGAGEALVKYLLFCEEAPLTAEVRGTTDFAAEFAKLGPRDRQGRSLRDFDLKQRTFRYPCSYLVYSSAFAALPDEVRGHVWRRLWEVVTGRNTSRDYAHLTAADRKAIREILADTHPGRPEYWRAD